MLNGQAPKELHLIIISWTTFQALPILVCK